MTTDKRLIYRVILKLLGLLALLVLLYVLVSSLFLKKDQYSQEAIKKETLIVTLSLAGMHQGEVRKTYWSGKEVAVLKRKNTQVLHSIKVKPNISHPVLDSTLRSIKPEYFVYYNHGDSGHCPLFKEADGFKDTCTGTHFDTKGRALGGVSGKRIDIPPHDIQGDILLIGIWRSDG